ncbi:MAG: hypothetical protein ACAI43_01770 [Phycisphaerae bacterium]|nr:hypothetical protein [Tepidisphaeraceae bacterium]
MIRFECETCGRALRAAAEMAGRRGRCARCGGINRVPAGAGKVVHMAVDEAAEADGPVSVAVKRAPGASPFRSTADVEIAAGALSSETFVGLPGSGRGIALADAPVVARSAALLGTSAAADDMPTPDLSAELPAPAEVSAAVATPIDDEPVSYSRGDVADEPVDETPPPSAIADEAPEPVETLPMDDVRPATSCAGLAWGILALGVSLGFGLGVAVVRWAGV